MFWAGRRALASSCALDALAAAAGAGGDVAALHPRLSSVL